MKKNVFRGTIKRVKSIEESWGSLEDFVIFSTFGTEKHTLKMGDDFSFPESLERVYESLCDLERADLFDFQKKCEEYGKFGKTRRHIFC